MSNVVEDGLRTLSVRQLARSMGVAQWRLYQMISSGTAPPHFRIGKTYRFPVKSAEAWLDQRSGQGG